MQIVLDIQQILSVVDSDVGLEAIYAADGAPIRLSSRSHTNTPNTASEWMKLVQ